MGYNTTASTTTLTAKLTPTGRRKLIQTNNNLVTAFSLGDSDANYLAALPLVTGQVPSNGGDIGPYSTVTNSVAPNVIIKSSLIVNSTGATKKAIESSSSELTTELVANGVTSVSGTSVPAFIINRADANTDPLVNLYYSFGLPLKANDDYNYTALTSTYGGYANTALSGVAQTKILVLAIPNASFGDVIDGKTLKVELSGYTLYSTFQNTGLSLAVQDANYADAATNTQMFGKNIAFLVSDDIKKPNGGDAALSWATGYNKVKPFSVNGKQLYNLTTDTNVTQSADTLVGIAYLDKGLLVVTNPTIVNSFNTASTGTVVTYNSLSTSIIQNITCIANRGEFGNSTNTTFQLSDTPRISEIGLYDVDNDLIAIAKTDRQIAKNVNEFMAIGIKISL